MNLGSFFVEFVVAGYTAGDDVRGFVAVDGEEGGLPDVGSGARVLVIELADGVLFLGGTGGECNVSGRFGSRGWDSDGVGGAMDGLVGGSCVEVE